MQGLGCSGCALVRASLRVVLAVSLGVLAGCNALSPQVKLDTPTTAKPLPPKPAAAPTGSIYADAPQGRTLFEDRRAAQVGDLVLVQIDERQTASQASSAKASRTGSAAAAVPTVSGLPFKAVQGLNMQGSSSTNFEGKGETASRNVFSGSISATVVEVLPNGNLKIAGEKQIGINRDVEIIRLTGVVSPVHLRTGNIVSSQNIADARIDYQGRGYLDESLGMGWLSRFFMSVMPF